MSSCPVCAFEVSDTDVECRCCGAVIEKHTAPRYCSSPESFIEVTKTIKKERALESLPVRLPPEEFPEDKTDRLKRAFFNNVEKHELSLKERYFKGDDLNEEEEDSDGAA